MDRMKATITTNHGPIVIDLFEHQAPKTVKNFVGLAKGELDYKDDAGRTNPTPYFDGLIFHRIIPPTTWLNGKHTIFGEVADGPSREVVDKIAGVRTGAQDKPLEDVVIERVEIEA